MDEENEEILVSAAASLTEAFAAIGRAWEQAEKRRAATPHGHAQFNFGASGALVQQIIAGAPVDVFAAASPMEMDRLQKARLIEPTTRRDFATNRLVLIAPAASRLAGWQGLTASTVRRIAISSPDSVPSGRYARQTLEKRGLWKPVQPKLVFGENVRQTLSYVANGDADAGLVFRTDARIEKRVRTVAEAIPGRDHTPIRYPVAVLTASDHARAHAAAARRFVAFLATPAAQKILAGFGFGR
jgi:molybdate transport system substrate-binding protein